MMIGSLKSSYLTISYIGMGSRRDGSCQSFFEELGQIFNYGNIPQRNEGVEIRTQHRSAINMQQIDVSRTCYVEFLLPKEEVEKKMAEIKSCRDPRQRAALCNYLINSIHTIEFPIQSTQDLHRYRSNVVEAANGIEHLKFTRAQLIKLEVLPEPATVEREVARTAVSQQSTQQAANPRRFGKS